MYKCCFAHSFVDFSGATSYSFYCTSAVLLTVLLIFQERLAKKSVLDKDPEAKAMLELLGRGPVSEGMREGDELADEPEHHKVISLF